MDSYDSQNQLYQQQQQQYQQQMQQQSSQAYDPSQAQSYDPSQAQSYDYDHSTQAYYPTYPQSYQNPTSESYPQHQQYLQQQQQQQPYPSYYQPDYAAAAYQQPFQTDPNSGQFPPANVPAPQEAPQIADAFTGGTQPQQNAYYPQEPPPPQPQPQQNAYYPQEPQPPQPQPQHHHHHQQQQPAYDVPPGLNPAAAAAVAALSQLNQFAGKMEAAERAMAERQWQENNKGFGPMGRPQMHPSPYPHGPHPHAPVNFGPPVGRPPYRGGGRRGGARFGGGRSNFGHQRPRPDGGAPSFRGRGFKARGGGRRFEQPPQAFASPTYLEFEQSQAPEHKRRAPQVAWCDLCRVDCNTQEVLEQHINGKRHKKNLEKFEKFQKYGKVQSESQPKLSEQLEDGQGGENKVFDPENLPDASASENLQKASSVENLPSGAVADEVEQIQMGEQSGLQKVEEPTESLARKPWAHRFDDRRRGSKWNQMKFGRGGKHPRYSAVMSSSEAPKEESKYANERDFIPQGDDQPSNDQAQELVTEHQAQQDPGLQAQDSTAEPEVSEAAMETSDTGGVMVETKEKGTAPENASTEAKPDSVIMQGVSAPDVGVSSTNHVILPGLDLDEGSKSTE